MELDIYKMIELSEYWKIHIKNNVNYKECEDNYHCPICKFFKEVETEVDEQIKNIKS